jgi:hypothetical protein
MITIDKHICIAHTRRAGPIAASVYYNPGQCAMAEQRDVKVGCYPKPTAHKGDSSFLVLPSWRVVELAL